jgi:dTDP-4-amino-4,6-dideoxygalactose transaminase
MLKQELQPGTIPISQPSIGDAEKAAVLAVLESGMLVQGAQVARLEEGFASLTKTKHAIATSSGTTALHLALLAHGIGPGSEVITTPFTFVATANSLRLS